MDIENFSEEWNKQFYKNSGRHDSVLTVNDEQMTEEQQKKLKKSLRDVYGGINKSHNLMVLFGDMKLDKFSNTQKDMDFLEQMKFGRDKILGIFRVPKAILAQTDGVNFASAKVAQFIFARWTIKPKMERIVQQLNEFLVPLFPDSEGLFLDYEDPVPEDEEARTKRFTAGVNTWLTVNEVRELENLEMIEGGDSLYVQNTLSSIVDGDADGESEDADTEEGTTVAESKRLVKRISKDRFKQLHARSKDYYNKEKKVEKLKEDIKEKLKAGLRKQFKNNGKKDVKYREISNDSKLVFWERKNQIVERFLPKVEDAMVDVFLDEEKRVLSSINAQKDLRVKKITVDIEKILLDSKTEEKVLAAKVLPVLTELFKDAGAETLDFLNLDNEFDVNTPSTKKLLKENNRLLAVGVTDTTNDLIKKEVAAGLAEDESINVIAGRIRKVFKNASETRATLIARSESIRYNTQATEEAFVQSGVVKAKQWQMQPNADPRCQAMNGTIVGLGETFVDKGGKDKTGITVDYGDVTSPPLHPNCRCDLVPVFIKI